MESVAKLCEECVHYVSAECPGKPQSEAKKGGKTPCGKYQMYLGEDLDETVDIAGNSEAQPEATKKEDNEPEPITEPVKSKRIKGGAKSLEQKQSDFQRLSSIRLQKAIAAVKLLSNLNNKYAYAYMPQDIQALREALEATIAETFGQF